MNLCLKKYILCLGRWNFKKCAMKVNIVSKINYNFLYTTSTSNYDVRNFLGKENFGNYLVVKKLGKVSQPLIVPEHIDKPSYFQTGEPLRPPEQPEIKTESQIVELRKSCRFARNILNEVAKSIKVGITTENIDVIVHETAISLNCYPSPLNYRGFPRSCCTSVNNVACHGIPDNRPLKDGDIISVDVTVYHNGYHGDACETFLVGNVDEAGIHLVQTAKKCRDSAISICCPGVPFTEIGKEVERVAKEGDVRVVPAFVGHGIGKYFHGPPDIYHCYNTYGGKMEKGMTFTVEPVIAQGSENIVILEDGWTALMVDNGRAAQFEHTILITDDGHEILTKYSLDK